MLANTGRYYLQVESRATGGFSIAYDLALAAPETPIEPGTQDIEATVTVTFAIA